MLTYVRSWMQAQKSLLRRWTVELGLHNRLREGLCLLSAFFFSAAAVSHSPLPLALALCCSLGGLRAVLAALGGCAGAWVFWGQAGKPEILGCLLALGFALTLGFTRMARENGWLLPMAAGLCAALSGFAAQARPLQMYLLSIGVAIGSARLFGILQERRDSVAVWLGWAVAVLALSQVSLFGMSLGVPVAAALTVSGAFPLAALTGVALDLSGVTAMPMTAVLCLGWLAHLLPSKKPLALALAPALAGCLLLGLADRPELMPLPGLLVGGLAGLALPGSGVYVRRRGEVGVAQVRLELASGVFTRMRQLLREQAPVPVDEQALLLLSCERACGSCSSRKGCAGAEKAAGMPTSVLHQPVPGSFPFSCRKPGRLQAELRRGQEQLRQLMASHRRQEEGRAALLQQYGFVSQYLQELSDRLADRTSPRQRYRAEVAFCGNRPAPDNGDRCLSFAGTGARHYVILCDGMGTGIGAVDEGNNAGFLLKELLMAGFPAEHALETLNSLCALRQRAGAVTVDLAELQLDTGRVSLYKWGAAPSYLLDSHGKEKIGTVGTVPGLSVAEAGETVHRLSLKKGEILVMLSDGVSGEEALPGMASAGSAPLADTAARILDGGALGGDDATVAVVRLSSPETSYHK